MSLLIAAGISFKMFDIPVWSNLDKLSVVAHCFGILSLVAFFIFVCWFVFFKVKPLNIKMKLETKRKHQRGYNERKSFIKLTKYSKARVRAKR